jgi:Tol biopolymer transport system component
LWLRPLDSLTARPLPGTEGGNFPAWSPDSKSIIFAAAGKLKRVEITGGAPLTLCDAPGSPVTSTGTWNRDGVVLFGGASGLRRVSASGGGATQVTKADGRETGHGFPQFLPDGDRFLYFVASSDPAAQGIYASSLRNPGQRRLVVRTLAKAVYTPPRGGAPGYLLWMQNQTLVAQRFDPAKLELSGDAVSVAEEIGRLPNVPVRSAFWASEAGLLIYFVEPESARSTAVWIDRDGKKREDAAPPDSFRNLALSPDGTRMALERTENNSSNWDLWVREFRTAITTRLTFDPAEDTIPVWSPDGKMIAFSSNREGGTFQIYRKPASGAGTEERLTEGGDAKTVLDWSRDGKYLVYRQDSLHTGRDLMAIPVEGDRKPFPVVRTPFLESTAALSPDGRWVAYASNDSGHNEIYVQAFPGAGGPSGRWQVSNGPAYAVKWRGDGKELYYETQDTTGRMMAVSIQAGPQGIRAEPPQPLFTAEFLDGSLHQFDVTPDGKRFLIALRANENRRPLTVVSNWQASLRK